MPHHQPVYLTQPTKRLSDFNAHVARRGAPRNYTTKLSPTEWMVSGAPATGGGSAAILGFVQLCVGQYEVTKIGGSRIEFSSFVNFTDAVAALSSKPLRALTLVAALPRLAERTASDSAKVSRLPFNGRGQRELRHPAKGTAQ